MNEITTFHQDTRVHGARRTEQVVRNAYSKWISLSQSQALEDTSIGK